MRTGTSVRQAEPTGAVHCFLRFGSRGGHGMVVKDGEETKNKELRQNDAPSGPVMQAA